MSEEKSKPIGAVLCTGVGSIQALDFGRGYLDVTVRIFRTVKRQDIVNAVIGGKLVTTPPQKVHDCLVSEINKRDNCMVTVFEDEVA